VRFDHRVGQADWSQVYPSCGCWCCFLIPFIIVFRIFVLRSTGWRYRRTHPLLLWRHGSWELQLHWSAYTFLFTDPLYVSSYVYSLKVAAVSTLCCLGLGYPMAYAIARSDAAMRPVLLMLIVLPFWTSFLLRVYAWIGLLKNNGVINNLLMYLGVIHHPLAAAADRLRGVHRHRVFVFCRS